MEKPLSISDKPYLPTCEVSGQLKLSFMPCVVHVVALLIRAMTQPCVVQSPSAKRAKAGYYVQPQSSIYIQTILDQSFAGFLTQATLIPEE